MARAKITALACSAAPAGHARWTLRLLADKAIELGFCDQISHSTVQVVLKKNLPQPHRQRSWRIGAMTGEYLARMESVLHLYNLPFDEKRPVICSDELPAQLLGEVAVPLPMKAGKPKRTRPTSLRERRHEKTARGTNGLRDDFRISPAGLAADARS